jgi:hypothetical protein
MAARVATRDHPPHGCKHALTALRQDRGCVKGDDIIELVTR